MKLKNLFFVPIVGLLLCSCGSKEEATGIAPAIFTSVAQTLTAQYTPVPPTEAFITETPTTTTIATTPTPYLTPTKYSASATQSKCDNSVYLSDVTIPDGTTVTAGATFTKTWKIKNTGTCACRKY